MTNDFYPVKGWIEKAQSMAPGHRLFHFRLEEPLPAIPGQFLEVSLPGVGAFPVSTASVRQDGLFEACIRRAGRVTDALFSLPEGAEVGLRGPFGNGFPLEAFKGRDPLLVAGGLGMAPLRSVLQGLLAMEGDVGDIILLYGAREPEFLLFREELEALSAAGRIRLRFSVDFVAELPWEEPGAVCRVGLVPELLGDLDFRPEQTTAAICGPPALYGCVMEELAEMGLPPERIFATLERRMKCGVGECCHCVTGGVFVCREGPVFTLDELRKMEGAV